MWNGSRYRSGDTQGFYESWFQRANHPQRPLAFWIRYTLFVPRANPAAALGQLWAIYFDGESGRITAAKESMPIEGCTFATERLDVRIGESTLVDGALRGRCTMQSHVVDWDLRYGSDFPPLLLLPEPWYARPFPKTKVLVGSPNAVYRGSLTVDGMAVDVDGWRGSQNHNWGTRHTDRYAWGQVAGFDNAPDSFLECATVRVRAGPVLSPRLTMLVLRDEGNEYAFNRPLQVLRARGRYGFFGWKFAAGDSKVQIDGRIDATAESFVALPYENPPGGCKTCLNSKLANAEIIVRRAGQADRILGAERRAALEILTDLDDDGLPMAA